MYIPVAIETAEPSKTEKPSLPTAPKGGGQTRFKYSEHAG